MVFAGFNMNNKSSGAAPVTYSVSVDVVPVDINGIDGSFTGFGASSGTLPAGAGPVVVATGVSAGDSSFCSGTGNLSVADPGFFSVTNATLANLVVSGTNWSADVNNVTGNVVFTLPVGGTSPAPAPEEGGGEEPPPEEPLEPGFIGGPGMGGIV